MKKHIIILAGGIGKRMGDTLLPKQFLNLGNKPIIIHTLTHILESKLFDFIYIVMHPDWIEKTKQILSDNGLNEHFVHLIKGGTERMDSFENALLFLKERNVDSQDIILIHDGVRPFISKELLQRSIHETEKHPATIATLPIKDTPIIIQNNGDIKLVNRETLFRTQTPAGFKFSVIYDAFFHLTPQERQNITGIVQICPIRGIPIYPFPGDENNFKITTPLDLSLGEVLLNTLPQKTD